MNQTRPRCEKWPNIKIEAKKNYGRQNFFSQKKIFTKIKKNFFLQNFKLEFHVNDEFKQFLPSKVF